ncbi:GPH family glycoside/pentoside/hexuronide:cation symporter [Conyzicola nivalis]|uniref:GPH family glycoside/pentoside/hexuronide:cation symporter n=1 Tax=Conyzicola nivalis TaxID=1477021 RepID=A0ABV2QHS2_9MICO
MSAAESPLSRRTIAAYAVGSLGTGGFSTLPGLVLVYYLTDTLGIAALAAGALVAVAKIWDVVIDPVIGARSDRSLAVTGSRRRYMVLGALLLPLFFVLTFAVPPALGSAASWVWVLVAFTAAATAFSLFQVPYIALPAELTGDYDQRTRLVSVRVVVLTVAILLFGAGGPALRELGGADEHLGYLIMAVVAGLVIGAGLFVASFVAAKRQTTDAPAVSVAQSFRSGVVVLRRSQPFRALLGAFALQGLATGLMLAGAQYVATWVLESQAAVTLLFIALIAPAVLFAPVWQAVSRRVGKERAFVAASLLFALAALALTTLLAAPGDWVYLPVALAGAGFAGMQSLPLSMLPDVISTDAASHGGSAAGTFGGVWTAGETTGMALGATALTVVLAVTGYVDSVAGQTVAQPPAAIAGIVVSFSIVPAALVVVSLWAFSRYPLRRNTVDRPVEART